MWPSRTKARGLHEIQLFATRAIYEQGLFRHLLDRPTQNDRARNGQPETTSWYRCSCFAKLAETASNLAERGYLVKGKQVYIDGNFEPKEFENRDGGTKTSLDVNVRELQLLGQRGDDAGEVSPF